MDDAIDERRLARIIRLCIGSYDRHNLEGHLFPVVRITEELSATYDASRDVTIPAAYLHDIGRVRFDYLKRVGITHDLAGYHYSKYMLRRIGVGKACADKISRCILSHSGNRRYPPGSIEEHVIMNADAIAHFTQYQYLLCIRYASHGLDLKDSRRWVLGKLMTSYDTKLSLPGIKHIRLEAYRGVADLEEVYRRARTELDHL
jgi:hypothetical protein